MPWLYKFNNTPDLCAYKNVPLCFLRVAVLGCSLMYGTYRKSLSESKEQNYGTRVQSTTNKKEKLCFLCIVYKQGKKKIKSES